jgi:hypothetical protein
VRPPWNKTYREPQRQTRRGRNSRSRPPTVASTVDLEISAIEKQSVEVAEAIPEDKYNFSRGSLNIPGSDVTIDAVNHKSLSSAPRPKIRIFSV